MIRLQIQSFAMRTTVPAPSLRESLPFLVSRAHWALLSVCFCLLLTPWLSHCEAPLVFQHFLCLYPSIHTLDSACCGQEEVFLRFSMNFLEFKDYYKKTENFIKLSILTHQHDIFLFIETLNVDPMSFTIFHICPAYNLMCELLDFMHWRQRVFNILPGLH